MHNDQLVVENMDLAQRMARKKNRSIPHVSYDDLESAAYFGLVDAASKYDPEQNDNFSAYASVRIAGAMCDYLRELQWGSRSAPVEMAEVHVYEEHLFDVEMRPECEDELLDKLTAILPDRSREVVHHYYVGEKKIREIADDMGVHESRVSQVLSESRRLLRNAWQDCESELWAEVA